MIFFPGDITGQNGQAKMLYSMFSLQSSRKAKPNLGAVTDPSFPYAASVII